MAAHGLDIPNAESRRRFEDSSPDARVAAPQNRRMASPPEEDWYLQEWMVHFGKRQASLTNELGWDKAKASFVWNGRQPYKKNLVNEIAAWLGIRPYELLMTPRDAMALRRLRQTAVQIAAEEEGVPFEGPARTAPPRRARG
jgi:hypothetical protein